MKLFENLWLLIFVSSSCFASHPEIVLHGNMIQGGLVTGKVSPTTQLSLNKHPIFVNKDGDFAFGFGRDEALSLILKVHNQGETDQSIRLKIKPRKYNIQRINGLPKDKVNPRTKQQKQRIRADIMLVSKARQNRTQKANFLDTFIWPAAGRISGVYGSQRILNGELKRPHFGVDIANKTGSTIIAPAGGVVVLAEPDLYFSGGTIIIDHGGGIFSSFLHLSKLNVTLNQTVQQGQNIALMGATGRVTGPHLDWRINWFNVRLDAELLVSGPPPKTITERKAHVR